MFAYLTPSRRYLVSVSKSKPFSCEGVVLSSFFSQYQFGIFETSVTLLVSCKTIKLCLFLDFSAFCLQFHISQIDGKFETPQNLLKSAAHA